MCVILHVREHVVGVRLSMCFAFVVCLYDGVFTLGLQTAHSTTAASNTQAHKHVNM